MGKITATIVPSDRAGEKCQADHISNEKVSHISPLSTVIAKETDSRKVGSSGSMSAAQYNLMQACDSWPTIRNSLVARIHMQTFPCSLKSGSVGLVGVGCWC